MSDADRLSEIRARLNAATAGEWHVLRPGDEVLVAGTEANIAFLLAELSRLSEKLAMRTEQTVAAEAETREYRAEVSRLSTVIEETSKRLESILGSPYNEYDRIPAWASGYLRELKDALSVPVSPKEKN